MGNIMGVAFGGLRPDLAWRLILGSTVVAPVIVMTQVYFCPESPRWLIQHNKCRKALHEFRRLRPTDVQAARDVYYTYVGVELERKINKGKNLFTQFYELFSVPRNARATWATWIVMFGQQFCGSVHIHKRRRTSELFADRATQCQHHCVLQHNYLRGQRLRSDACSTCIYGHGYVY